ncbi:MAG: AAA family ATPase [Candidatus Sulfotelmatobacter sp.]|jgi:hypothetical protein
MRFKSAREILSPESRVEVKWIAKPWLAQSAITDLVGKAKVAGKTTWALSLCAAVLDGRDFMDSPTTKSGIVYLTEESEVTFRLALERANIGPRDDFHALFWRETLGTEWKDAMEEAVGVAIKNNAGVLVVDTLAQFAQLTGDRENNSGDALGAVLPLQIARDRGLGILMLRHERKQGGALGDSGRGSSAFAGAVDIILNLGRPKGNTDENIRTIDGVSRLGDEGLKLTIKLTTEGYQSCGVTTRPIADAAEESIMKYLPDSAEKAVDLKQIISATGETRATIQRTLAELKKQGRVFEEGTGVRSNPKRYYSGMNSAQNRSPGV